MASNALRLGALPKAGCRPASRRERAGKPRPGIEAGGLRHQAQPRVAQLPPSQRGRLSPRQQGEGGTWLASRGQRQPRKLFSSPAPSLAPLPPLPSLSDPPEATIPPSLGHHLNLLPQLPPRAAVCVGAGVLPVPT